MFCQNCGAKLPENVKFCPYCGTKIEMPEPKVEEVKQEVIDAKPEQEFKQSSQRYTDEEIRKMRVELEDHERRKRNFVTAGSILLGIGVFLFILGLVLLCVGVAEAVNTDGDPIAISGAVFGYIFVVLGPLMAVGGGALLAIGNAVFGKKADNRRRAIKEHEEGR